MQYQKKAIISGNHIRILEVIGMYIGYGYESKKRNFNKSLEGEKENKSLRRAQDNLVQTINCNVNKHSKLITLTFKEPITERTDAIKKFKVFQKYFKRYYNEKLKYCGVTERQKKRGKKEGNEGAWHFHLVVFNNQYLDIQQLDKLWIYGHADYQKIDSVDNLGRYLGKYLSKQKTDIKINEKAVIKSQGLKKPLTVYDSQIPYRLENAPTTFKNSYDHIIEETGEVIAFTCSEYIIPKDTTNINKQVVVDALNLFGDIVKIKPLRRN